MPRTTNAAASRKHRKRHLELAKGFYGARSKQFRLATEAVDRAMKLSYTHRKDRKREFRALWITRINAATRNEGMTYSRFMEGLTKAGIEINRKMLSEVAIADADGFKSLIEKARAALA